MALILANLEAITKTQFLKSEIEANPEAQMSNTNTFTKQIYIYIYLHKLIQQREKGGGIQVLLQAARQAQAEQRLF